MVSRRIQTYAIGLLFCAVAIPHDGSIHAQEPQQVESAQPNLDEVEKTLRQGNPDQKIAALAMIGEGNDQLDRRVRLIADAMTSNDPSIQATCKLLIEQMGNKVKPTLVELLESDQKIDTIRACGIVSALGSDGDEFADQVIELLKDGDTSQRHASLYALQNLSPKAIAGSVELVTKELDATNFNTQCIACAVIRQCGAGAKSAAPRLVQLLQEGNVSTRSRAAQALAAISPVEGFDIPELLGKRLGAFSQVEKTRVLEALGDLGLDAVDQLESIEDLMNTPSKHCQCDAALAYYRVSGKTKQPIQVLLEQVSRRTNRILAIECLGGMKQDAAAAVPTLMKYLDDEDLVIVETTVLALKNIGPAAEEALPKLQQLAKSDDFLMSVAAKEAIDAITKTPDPSASM